MVNGLTVISICVLLSVIVVSDIFCEDFSLKTIKTLFVRPNKREAVLTSKIAASMIVYIYFSFLVIVISFGFSAFFYDISLKNQVVLFIDANGVVVQKAYLLYFFQQYVCVLIEGTAYILLGIMCAAISKSAAITSVISVVSIMGSNTFILFFEEKAEIIKYLLFYNTDLSQYLNNGTNYWETSMVFSVGILLIYCTIFLIISHYFYCKKDIY